MKIEITNLTFTPQRVKRFKPCEPFLINGITIRVDNRGCIIKSHPNMQELMKTKSCDQLLMKAYRLAGKYMKDEGIYDAMFSHWEQIKGHPPIKFK